MSKKTISGPPADPTVVRALTTQLLNAFNSFTANFDGELTFNEILIATHNFHVFVIEQLVHETGNPIWRDAAVTTFKRRMDNPGAYDTKGGKDV